MVGGLLMDRKNNHKIMKNNIYPNTKNWIIDIANLHIDFIKKNIFNYNNINTNEISAIFLAWAPWFWKTEFIETLIETDFFYIIDIDNYRCHFKWYNWKNASEFQNSSVKVANKIFKFCIKNNIKFIFDWTFRKIGIARQNMEQLEKNNRKALIFYIFQNPMLSYYYTYIRKINKKRNVPIDVFISWFYDSLRNIFLINNEFKNVQLTIWFKNKNIWFNNSWFSIRRDIKFNVSP